MSVPISHFMWSKKKHLTKNSNLFYNIQMSHFFNHVFFVIFDVEDNRCFMIELNKIYNEDCLVTMSNMDDNMIDIVMTSPPYNISKRKGGISDTGRYDVYEDWKIEQDYIDFTISLFTNFDRVVKKDGVVLYNFSYSIENPTLPYLLVAEISKSTSWCLADTIIWKKSAGLPFPANERRLSRNWEFVWVFVRKDEINTFKCNKGIKKTSVKTGQNYYNVFYNFVEAKNNDGQTHGLNQATYSTELCQKLFDIYADEGYVIYDPFMGTGTTANACVLSGLNYIGSEMSEKQVEYAVGRIEESLCVKNKIEGTEDNTLW